MEGKDWCAAVELEIGDVLRTQDGETKIVEDVQIEQLDKAVKVYNLEIEDSHTYYVSPNEVLVYNGCDIPWLSGKVTYTASEISHGASSVTVSNRSQAEELFLGLFQGLGYKNTTGQGKRLRTILAVKNLHIIGM